MCRGLTELHRINLDPKIQSKYVDTKNQFANMLTKDTCARDEWNNLLHLFNIMNDTTFSRSHFFLSKGKQAVMSKWSQESCSLDSPTVKATSRSFNLVSHQSLSMRENSQMTINPTIPVSTRTEGVSTCIEEPLLENTSRDSVWDSQERSQGDKVKKDPEHPEQGYSSICIRETTAVRFGFFSSGW